MGEALILFAVAEGASFGRNGAGRVLCGAGLPRANAPFHLESHSQGIVTIIFFSVTNKPHTDTYTHTHTHTHIHSTLLMVLFR